MRFDCIFFAVLLPLLAHADDAPGHLFAAQAHAYTHGLAPRKAGAFMSYVTGVSTMAEATDFICLDRTPQPEIVRAVADFVLAHPRLWTTQNSFELTTAALVDTYHCNTRIISRR